MVFGLHVTKDEEYVGYDISPHGETMSQSVEKYL